MALQKLGRLSRRLSQIFRGKPGFTTLVCCRQNLLTSLAWPVPGRGRRIAEAASAHTSSNPGFVLTAALGTKLLKGTPTA